MARRSRPRTIAGTTTIAGDQEGAALRDATLNYLKVIALEPPIRHQRKRSSSYDCIHSEEIARMKSEGAPFEIEGELVCN